MKDNEKITQIRMTFNDVLLYQKRLTALLERKTKNPILTQAEKEDLPMLAANSLLSACSRDVFIFTYQNIAFRFSNIYSLFLKMLTFANAEFVVFKSHNGNIRIPVKEIWKALLNKCYDLYAKALQESLAMSREMPRRTPAKPFAFNPNKKLSDMEGDENE